MDAEAAATTRRRSDRNITFNSNSSTNLGSKCNSKVSNFSDLIQRVTASCLLNPLQSFRHEDDHHHPNYDTTDYENHDTSSSEEEEDDDERNMQNDEDCNRSGGEVNNATLTTDMETLMNEVFDSVASMKRSYAALQEAHCPWDPERMRAADVAVVAELRKLGVLRERFKRCVVGGSGGGRRRRRSEVGGLLREVVAPYEAAVEELKREIKTKEVEVESLKEKLKSVSVVGNGEGKKGRSRSKTQVSCGTHLAASAQVAAAAPAPELFEATMNQVKKISKSFTSLLLSLMRTAHWDIAAAVRSIEAAAAIGDDASLTTTTTSTAIASAISNQHTKYALESYLSRKIFQGFDHETFYMDGSLSSLLNPDQFRRDCFTQYRDMKAMDPVELLGILPTCHFGKFCFKKYLAIVHPKMEESLFGNLEQREQVLAGSHPRSQFYGDFLALAKAVWLLHLLSFSLEPAPTQFEASRGAEFHPQYMESVVKFSSGRIPAGQIVGFLVTPGFKLGNRSIIKARVYLVPRT